MYELTGCAQNVSDSWCDFGSVVSHSLDAISGVSSETCHVKLQVKGKAVDHDKVLLSHGGGGVKGAEATGFNYTGSFIVTGLRGGREGGRDEREGGRERERERER